MHVRKDRETVETLEEAIRKYEYDALTGVFTWRIDTPPARKGSLAGNRWKHGYIRLRLFNIFHSAHRVAFAMMTGRWPDELIDHIDGDGFNNRWDNLREVSNLGNKRNVKLDHRNSSGFTGVYWNKKERRWKASIRVNYELIHLGYHDQIVDAVAARIRANRKYGFHPNHGRR